MSFEDCTWLNEPPSWRIDRDELTVQTAGGTDFWRETHYGFTRDTGHFLAFRTEGDFTAQVRVRARFRDLYDQAGLMVRADETRWVKAGIELSDGVPMLSSVLTNALSDWATAPYGGDASDFRIRATVGAGVLRLQVSADGTSWPLMRLSPFPAAASYLVGPMCCAPQGEGVPVLFSDFSVGASTGKDLHDLS